MVLIFINIYVRIKHMTSVETRVNVPPMGGGETRPEDGSLLLRLVKDLPDAIKVASRVIRGEPIGFSFNVADRCPINCNCYWRAMNRVEELEPDAMVDFFGGKRQEGYVHANMVGGEPYVHLKNDLLERLADTMPSSWITTSGVTRLKHIPNVLHFVSVDGANAETHNSVRGYPGLYEKILKNLAEARSTGFFPACLHVTLNSQNYTQAPQILETWHESGLVDGVAFSTHTPIEGASDDWLLLSDEQKWRIVADLLRQKKTHQGFLLNSDAMIRHVHPLAMSEQTPETCATAKYVTSYHADGSRIEQCIFSEKGDCAKCGCVVTTALDNLVNFGKFDIDTFRSIRQLLPPFKQAAKTIELADTLSH